MDTDDPQSLQSLPRRQSRAHDTVALLLQTAALNALANLTLALSVPYLPSAALMAAILIALLMLALYLRADHQPHHLQPTTYATAATATLVFYNYVQLSESVDVDNHPLAKEDQLEVHVETDPLDNSLVRLHMLLDLVLIVQLLLLSHSLFRLTHAVFATRGSFHAWITPFARQTSYSSATGGRPSVWSTHLSCDDEFGDSGRSRIWKRASMGERRPSRSVVDASEAPSAAARSPPRSPKTRVRLAWLLGGGARTTRAADRCDGPRRASDDGGLR